MIREPLFFLEGGSPPNESLAAGGRDDSLAEFPVILHGRHGWPRPAELAHQFRPENGQELQIGHTPNIGENTTPKFTKNNMYDDA
jgi:hypothetical protein